MRFRLGLVGLASLALLAVQPAAAQDGGALPLQLTWRAPSECPTSDDVQAELARIAQVAPGEALSPLTADVTVARRGAGYGARIATEHEGLAGERTLQAEDCQTLARSVTLVLALAFGPGVQLRDDASAAQAGATTAPAGPAPPATPPPAPQASAPEALDADRSSEPEPRDESDAPLKLGALLGGGAVLALMPELAFALHAGAALDLGPLAIELRASALPAVEKALAAGATARFDALALTALACAHVSVARACVGPRAGLLRARSRGLFRDDDAVAPFYALALATGVRWPEQGPVQVGVEALLGIALTRPRFEVAGLGRAHRAPLLAPELSALLYFWP